MSRPDSIEEKPIIRPKGDGGYSAANFAIGSSMAPDGRLSSSILYNPPHLGKHFVELGKARLILAANGKILMDNECNDISVDSCWPFANATYSDERLGGIAISISSFAPVAPIDENDTALPAIFYDVLIKGGNKDANLSLFFAYQLNNIYSNLSARSCDALQFFGNNFTGIAASILSDYSVYTDNTGRMGPLLQDIGRKKLSKTDSGNVIVIKSELVVRAGEEKDIKVALVVYENTSAAAARLDSIYNLTSYISSNWDNLRRKTIEFLSLIPKTGDIELDTYLRWYMTASIMNTKLLREGTAVVMSYVELNGRDTFWACYTHLIFWPELEKRMIKEIAEKQYIIPNQNWQGQKLGQIPTTVLPEIWRMWDIDIDEYFVLRVWRYINWTGDVEFLRFLYPNVQLAIQYILSWDSDNDFVPECPNYWADWKDIGFMDGRTDALDIALLWLAALDAAINMAERMEDVISAQLYRQIRDNAYHNINKGFEEGGLWNGNFYQNRWKDWIDKRVYEDQVFGIVFGVVDQEKVEKIYKALQPNETPWGVREQYPYRNDSKTLSICGPGVYHNGGVWVYLNFVDAFSRFVSGYYEDAVRIIKKVAVHDLKKNNDFKPNEWLHGETGENKGNKIQAWNSVLFGSIYFGYMGIKKVGENRFVISPYNSSTFTSVLLPNAIVNIRCKDNALVSLDVFPIDSYKPLPEVAYVPRGI